MSDVRVQVTYRMWKADRKILRRYAIQNDMTVQEFIECAVAKEMLARGLTAPQASNAPQMGTGICSEPVPVQNPDGTWSVRWLNRTEWESHVDGFKTHADAYRWIDRFNNDPVSQSERMVDWIWRKKCAAE